MQPDPLAETTLLIPLCQLTDFARLVLSMRKAQKAYFKKRAELQKAKALHLNADAELAAAMKAERECDAAITAALARERQALPGMGDGEGGGP